MDPRPDDTFVASRPERVAYEIHSRMTAPLYALAFALIALAFLGRPRTNRQDRSIAIATVVLLCLVLRAAGFAAGAMARGSSTSIPFLYAIPVAGIVLGAYAIALGARLRMPRLLEAVWDGAADVGQRALRRAAPPVAAEGGGQ